MTAVEEPLGGCSPHGGSATGYRPKFTMLWMILAGMAHLAFGGLCMALGRSGSPRCSGAVSISAPTFCPWLL